MSLKTQLSLLGLGMTRSSAVLLSEFIPADDWSTSDCLSWLRDNDLDSLDLPVLIRADIEAALALAEKRQGRKTKQS